MAPSPSPCLRPCGWPDTAPDPLGRYLYVSLNGAGRIANINIGPARPHRRRGAQIAVRLVHRECDNQVCKLASYTYGTGKPTLWRHENLNDETHEWLRGEFAAVPLTFFVQMLEWDFGFFHGATLGSAQGRSSRNIGGTASVPSAKSLERD